MSHLRTVLTTRGVATLLTTSMVGRLPTAMATLGVLLLVRGEGGDYTVAGTLAALVTAGTSMGLPLLSRMVDRRGQRPVLLGSAATNAIAFGVLSVSGTHRPVVSAVAATVAGLSTPPLEPCLRALWPQVVSPGAALRAAFNLDVGVQEVIFVAGPLLVTAGVATAGHRAGVAACAIFGVAGTVGFARSAASRAWRPAPRNASRHGSPIRHPVLVRDFVVAAGLGVPVGALPIVAATFASRHGNTSLIGWTLAANAAGALAAGLYGATHHTLRPTAAGMTAAGLALALAYLPLCLPVPAAAWLVLAALAGLALPVALSLVFQRIQQHSPANLVTEANAWVVTSFGTGASVAALLAGIVADHNKSQSAIVMTIGASAAITAVCATVTYRRDPPGCPW